MFFWIASKINKIFDYSLFGSGEWKIWEVIHRHKFLLRLFPYKLHIRDWDDRYKDPGEVVLHASMEALCKFREEYMFTQIDWMSEDYHKNIYYKTMHLYNWWMYKRPARYYPEHTGELPYILNNMRFSSEANETAWNIYCKMTDKFEEFYFQEDQDMLQLLISIRRGMWT